MTTSDYVRISPSGHWEFVRSNSFADHRHRSRRHVCRCHDDCCGARRAEYDTLVEQNRTLRDHNGALQQKSDALNGELHRAAQANKDFADMNAHLSEDIQYLRDENARLRRSFSVDDRHSDGFKRRIKDLEKEVENLKKKVKLQADERRRIIKDDTAIIHRLEEKERRANEEARHYKSLVEELRRRRDHLETLVKRRDVQLEDAAADIRRLQELLARYRGW